MRWGSEMAVDLHIGTIETVIEAGGSGAEDRRALIAEILRAVMQEMERTAAERAARDRDTAATPRSFGRRF